MKKGKAITDKAPQRNRIVFFDVLRIAFVAIIVYGHAKYNLIPWFNDIFFTDGFTPFNIYALGLTPDAVFGMIFVSGAVLEYNYRGLERFSDYTKFIFRRFVRLYPAFWMSLVLGILVLPSLLQENLFELIFEFTGFFVILGNGPGNINVMGWFIAAIFSLYIIFPYVSKFVRKYQLSAVFLLMMVSFGLRYLVTSYASASLGYLFYRWFPLCNVFEFGLGIYVIIKKFYPKNENVYPTIRKISDLSFYVFLFHAIVINAIVSATFDPYISYSGPVVYTLYYVAVMGAVVLVSGIAMIIDTRIQHAIFQNTRVRAFLSS